CYQQALTLKPDFAEAHNNLGNALKEQGKLTEAIAAYRQALALKPDFTDAHSNLLLCLHYGADTEPAAVFIEHQRWAEQHALSLADTIDPHANDPTPNRRLRIGYLSPDFRTHSVAYFVEPLLAAHDRAGFEVICYANVVRPDSLTKRLQSLVHKWRNIVPLSDAEVADLVREDGVDILVDLAGHTGKNRLLVFARKPAPVQVSYLGYPNTTALATMDYRLTDAWADPPGHMENSYTEELVRLPHGFLCYRPPQDSPEVAELPALSAGHITFASFNNASKVNANVIGLWSKILRALPDARLIMKARPLGDVGTRQRFEELFEQNGVSTGRVELLGWASSTAEHLELYNRVDIGLDPFPYNGTTTTCEALWMGVPVIVLAGTTHAARVGVSLLSSVGLPELIADTPEAYVALAISLAGDLDRLQQLRAELRAKVARSPVTDETRFTRALEGVYRNVWHGWCQRQSHSATSGRMPPHGEPRSTAYASQQAAPLIVNVRGDIQVCLPNSVVLLTPYVLLEQEDWFEDEIGFVRKLLKPSMHAIDIGASYGVYTLMMARAVGPTGKVWSFEPANGAAAFLEKSIKQNQCAHIVLFQIALSNRTGVAKLRINMNCELDRLAQPGDFDSDCEDVQLRTLDECVQEHGWETIDFVKMDVEGEECRIVEGGKQFLSKQSPLILFELKHGDEFNLSLPQQFEDMGYAIYRLLPGLNILVPFDTEEELDPYQLNLFCCKPDRAEILEQQGLLAKSESIPPELPRAKTPVWPDFLCKLPYAQKWPRSWVTVENSKRSPGGEAYQEALDCYTQAHMEKFSAALRYGYLKRCFAILSEVAAQKGNLCRLQSLA
ncbi:MAG: FkbM family methyltransferase, partial [Acidiferrobacterales bacterium]